MFKSTYLGTSFPEREAWSHAFEYLRDIVAMIEIRSALVKAIEEAVAGFNKVVAKDRSITLPALGNAEERCDAFAQKMGSWPVLVIDHSGISDTSSLLYLGSPYTHV